MLTIKIITSPAQLGGAPWLMGSTYHIPRALSHAAKLDTHHQHQNDNNNYHHHDVCWDQQPGDTPEPAKLGTGPDMICWVSTDLLPGWQCHLTYLEMQVKEPLTRNSQVFANRSGNNSLETFHMETLPHRHTCLIIIVEVALGQRFLDCL